MKGAANGAIKSKIPTSVKLKIYLALAGIVVMIFVIAFLTVLFSSDTQMSAMSTFFGVAEKETSEGANDGLYTDEEYQPIKENREHLRKRINSLEEELSKIEI